MELSDSDASDGTITCDGSQYNLPKNAICHTIVQSRSTDVAMLQETLTGNAMLFSRDPSYVLSNAVGTRILVTLVAVTLAQGSRILHTLEMVLNVSLLRFP